MSRKVLEQPREFEIEASSAPPDSRLVRHFRIRKVIERPRKLDVEAGPAAADSESNGTIPEIPGLGK